jgi:hypothetical protein
MRLLRFISPTIALAWLTACSTVPTVAKGPLDNEALYASLYPYYVEFCALSEIEKKPGFGADISGGIGGHSVMYLNGVCREADAGYPTIRLCDTADGSTGVGLSVNAHFKNANWVAIEGRDFFYRGDLQPGQQLTRAAYRATQAHAQQMGIYEGVQFYDSVFADMPANFTRPDYKYEVSIATDYAIGFGRDRYCARVPVSRAEMINIVEYLNGLNKPYKERKAEFRWSVLQNNCTHVTHNALTAAGVWGERRTNRFILFAALNFPVPKNEFVNLMRRTNDMPLFDLSALYQDSAARQALLAGKGLPVRAGALAVIEPVAQKNDLYETNLDLIFYDDGLFGPYEGWYRDIVSQTRYSDILENLRYFSDLYAKIKADKRPLSWWLASTAGLASADERDFATFYEKFYQHIDRESAWTGASLRRVDAGPAGTGQVSIGPLHGGSY